MLRSTIRMIIIAAVLAFATTSVQAQQSYRLFEEKEWFGSFHAGYMIPLGHFADVTDDGWLVGAGLSFTPAGGPISIDFGLDWHENDFKRNVAQIFDSDKGTVEITSLSTGVRWTPNTRGNTGMYVKAGASYNWVEARVSDYAWVPGYICNPWDWWWCYPGWVPGEIVNARLSTNEWGYYAGIGVSIETSATSSIYFEAAYKVIKTRVDTEYMPLIFGFRF